MVHTSHHKLSFRVTVLNHSVGLQWLIAVATDDELFPYSLFLWLFWLEPELFVNVLSRLVSVCNC